MPLFAQGTKIFKIDVRDGDTGKPRKIELSIIGDRQGFFVLEDEKYEEKTGIMTAWLTKSNRNALDRENPVRNINAFTVYYYYEC